METSYSIATSERKALPPGQCDCGLPGKTEDHSLSFVPSPHSDEPEILQHNQIYLSQLSKTLTGNSMI